MPISIPYRQAVYTISAPKLELCPTDSVAEVAFIGRSNAGKSSAINALTDQNKLARTSKTPGRTQLLNYFTLVPGRYLVDVPGFGYAKVSASQKQQWQKQLVRYLEEREPLKGLVMLMDIRHPFMDSDTMMIQWCIKAGIPLRILLTKADKLAYGASKSALLQVRKQLKEQAAQVSVQLFSSLNRQGVDELKACLDGWLGEDEAEAGEAAAAE
ncbi:MAG: ribosome biogenesis GTP-binding protein YihA/YsxC [Gammaproteobacteria bacterium]